MDKKKIIGTIIGVLMFGALIAGATFAWFTDDPSADATGLSIKAATSTGLVALSATEETAGGDFSHHTKLNAITSGGSIITDPTIEELSPVSINASGAV